MSCQHSNSEIFCSLLLANLPPLSLCQGGRLSKNAHSRQQVSCEYSLPERNQQCERLALLQSEVKGASKTMWCIAVS